MLNVTGSQNERHLTQILNAAKRDGDVEVEYQAGITMRGIILARLYVMKFLDTNSRADADRAFLEIKNNDEQLNNLDRLLENPERRALFEQVKAGDDKYHQAFVRLKDAVFEGNAIIAGTLDRIGPEIAKTVEEVTLSVKGDQNEKCSDGCLSLRADERNHQRDRPKYRKWPSQYRQGR